MPHLIRVNMEIEERHGITGVCVKQRAAGRGEVWVLVDRPEIGNDNAWHLFQYLRKHRRDIDAHFVMSRGADLFWQARKKYRTRIVEFQTNRWAKVMRRCTALISSQRVSQIHSHPDEKASPKKGNRARTFVYLAHGVARGNNLESLARDSIDLLLTATHREHLQALEFGQQRGADNTVLTGLARWDYLSKNNSQGAGEQRIIVAPTWRSQFVQFRNENSMETQLDMRIFLSSPWLSFWRELLVSLKAQADSAALGKPCAFLLHPQMATLADYWHEVGMPEVEFLRYGDPEFQDKFKQAQALVTDYSSIAFDAGVCAIPVVYFHFEAERDVSNGHTVPGWFSYAKHGLGPIATSASEVISHLMNLGVDGKVLDNPYRDRSKKLFSHADGQASRRITDAVEDFQRRHPQPG